MKLQAEKVHLDSQSGMHWMRVAAEFGDEGVSVVLVCAARNYIADTYNPTGIATDEAQKQWFDAVLNDIQADESEMVAREEPYTKVYATSPEGESAARKFIAEKMAI